MRATFGPIQMSAYLAFSGQKKSEYRHVLAEQDLL